MKSDDDSINTLQNEVISKLKEQLKDVKNFKIKKRDSNIIQIEIASKLRCTKS